jgi:thioesterase domain-containing protein
MNTATETEMIPASPLMEALWWVHHRAKNKSVYNLTWPLACDRPLDPDALAAAWRTVVNRHEALRSSLHHRDGKILLHIAAHIDTEPQWVRVAEPGSTPAHALLRAVAAEIHERPVALDRAPAGRLTAVTVADAQELLLTLHHSLVDGWAIQLLMNDFSAAYAAATEGREPVFESEPVSLRQYTVDAYEARVSGRWDPSLAFWREALDGAVTTTLVADRHQYTGTGNKGTIVRFALSKEAVDGIAALAKQYMATPFGIIFAAVQTVLACGGGGPDVCSGMVSANRLSPQEQAMVGYLANVLVVRSKIESGDSFGAIVERTRDTMWGMLAHQSVPFSLVFGSLTESAQARLRDSIPVLVTYYGPIGSGLTLGDVNLRLEQAPNRTARTDIGFGVFDVDGGYLLEGEYNTGRYDHETALRLFHDIDAVLAAGGADPARPMSTIDIRSKTAPAHVEHRISTTEAGTAAAMPVSAAMDHVRRVWTEVLGTEPSGPDEDFFAMGGRSLKVVQLASTIMAETGVAFDLVRWLTDPTPRSAAEQISADDSSAGGTLVELRDGTGPHMHVIPGAGGTVQDYHDLIAALPKDWRVTASQERAPLASVPEMARYFRADLDAAGVRPDLLVGWSMGGQIAYEMATGYPAGSPPVVVIDSTVPIGHSVTEEEVNEAVSDTFALITANTLGVTLDGSSPQITAGDEELSMRVLAARLSAASGQQVPASMLLDRWRTFHRHTMAVVSYVSRARVAAPALVIAADLSDYQLDQWSQRFTTPPRLLRVEADHYGVLRQPAIGALADAISELLASAASRA